MALTVTIRSLVLTSVTNLFTENDMNRYFKILATAVAAAGLLASCNRVDVTPDQPDLPGISKYEQLTFSSADEPSTRAMWSDEKGSGSLIFNWEADETGTQMVALLSDGNGFVRNYPSANPTEEELQEEVIHTFMTISPKEDLHRADFTTVRYYDMEEMARATDIFVAAPLKATDKFYNDNGIGFEARMEMPAVFTQTESQNPEFLRDYMMMYGHATVENGNASIQFKHIPATFRFIITNKRPDEATIESVSMTIDDDAPIGSRYAAVWGYYDLVDINLECFAKHTSITTNLNATLESQEVYTAYAMALPLEFGATLEDKDVKFVINTVEHGFLSFVLTGAQIANANPGNEFNWVGGKSYTIRMSLNDVLTFESITVKDWTQEEIEGGEAEEAEEAEGDEEDEWPNGINIYTGEYQPATLNAEGAYEIANAGNLMWMSEQIGARTIGIPYTIKLVEDVTIGEDLKWIPIAHPDGTGNASVFDGNGHTLTINQNCQDASESNFGIYASFNYSVIKNLTIKGDVVINTPSAVGVVAGTAYRTTISCVTSYANITNLGNGRVGGLVGQFGGQHSGDKYSLIENCAVYANISGTIAGGIIGYGWAGWQYYDIKNSAFYGDVTGTTHQGAIIGYHANNQTATQCTFKHIYHYEKDGIAFSGGGNTNYTLGADVIAKTPAEFASATMAELLNADQENGPWEYVTGNDYPTLKK